MIENTDEFWNTQPFYIGDDSKLKTQWFYSFKSDIYKVFCPIKDKAMTNKPIDTSPPVYFYLDEVELSHKSQWDKVHEQVKKSLMELKEKEDCKKIPPLTPTRFSIIRKDSDNKPNLFIVASNQFWISKTDRSITMGILALPTIENWKYVGLRKDNVPICICVMPVVEIKVRFNFLRMTSCQNSCGDKDEFCSDVCKLRMDTYRESVRQMESEQLK